MSTNSSIWIQNADGTFEGIYCHWDGYVDGVGATLQQHYATKEKVERLISLGAISSLGVYTGHEFALLERSFNNPLDDVTVAYHRDRGEELRIYKETSQSATNQEEYNYVFVEGSWYVCFWETNDEYCPLRDYLPAEKDITPQTLQIAA